MRHHNKLFHLVFAQSVLPFPRDGFNADIFRREYRRFAPQLLPRFVHRGARRFVLRDLIMTRAAILAAVSFASLRAQWAWAKVTGAPTEGEKASRTALVSVRSPSTFLPYSYPSPSSWGTVLSSLESPKIVRFPSRNHRYYSSRPSFVAVASSPLHPGAVLT